MDNYGAVPVKPGRPLQLVPPGGPDPIEAKKRSSRIPAVREDGSEREAGMIHEEAADEPVLISDTLAQQHQPGIFYAACGKHKKSSLDADFVRSASGDYIVYVVVSGGRSQEESRAVENQGDILSRLQRPFEMLAESEIAAEGGCIQPKQRRPSNRKPLALAQCARILNSQGLLGSNVIRRQMVSVEWPATERDPWPRLKILFVKRFAEAAPTHWLRAAAVTTKTTCSERLVWKPAYHTRIEILRLLAQPLSATLQNANRQTLADEICGKRQSTGASTNDANVKQLVRR